MSVGVRGTVVFNAIADRTLVRGEGADGDRGDACCRLRESTSAARARSCWRRSAFSSAGVEVDEDDAAAAAAAAAGCAAADDDDGGVEEKACAGREGGDTPRKSNAAAATPAGDRSAEAFAAADSFNPSVSPLSLSVSAIDCSASLSLSMERIDGGGEGGGAAWRDAETSLQACMMMMKLAAKLTAKNNRDAV
jgi:hypothetical protein